VSSSPHGGITSEMLADIFRSLDKLGVYPRGEGIPNPVLLVDGHGSRLDEPFMEHIMGKEHRWHAFIGVPFGTGLWQVGDAKECNGTFKVVFYKAKQELIALRESLRMNIIFLPSDVIPLVNKAWDCSFGDPSKVRKALADRGWNPLNRALLANPDVMATMDAKDKETDVVQLNVDMEKAAKLIDDLKYRQNRQEARRRGTENKRKATEAQNNLERAKKLTAGKLVRNGHHALNEDVLSSIRAHNRGKREEEEQAKQKRGARFDDLFKKVTDVRAKGSPSKWNANDFRTMNTYKKGGHADTALAKTLPALRDQWDERKDRPSPTCPTRQLAQPLPRLPGQNPVEETELSDINSVETEHGDNQRQSI